MRARWEQLSAANVQLAEAYARLVCASRRARLPAASARGAAGGALAPTGAAGSAAGSAANGDAAATAAGAAGAVAVVTSPMVEPVLRETDFLEAGLAWDGAGGFYRVQVRRVASPARAWAAQCGRVD